MRLIGRDAIEGFRSLFLRHGVLGYGMPDRPVLNDASIFKVVPLVFGLMPAAAIYRDKGDMHIKPIIRAHFKNIELDYDEELVSIVKSISDQYYYTSPGYRSKVSAGTRKYTIRDVCASKGRVYREIKNRQAGRCAYCGVPFDGRGLETLDHIIPYRLVGDVLDGSNWRLACEKCNLGKTSIISIYLANEYHNWIYGGATSSEPGDASASVRTRYVVLARDRGCTHPDCTATAVSSELKVQRVVPTGLNVADCCATFCSTHQIKNHPSY